VRIVWVGGWHEPSPGTLILPTGTVTITTLLTFLHFAIVLYCGLLRSRGFFVNFGIKKKVGLAICVCFGSVITFRPTSISTVIVLWCPCCVCCTNM